MQEPAKGPSPSHALCDILRFRLPLARRGRRRRGKRFQNPVL